MPHHGRLNEVRSEKERRVFADPSCSNLGVLAIVREVPCEVTILTVKITTGSANYAMDQGFLGRGSSPENLA